MDNVLLPISGETLRPLLKAVVAEALSQLSQKTGPADRLAYTESEAAALLGLTGRQLAEQRRARRLGFSRGPKGTILYSKADLLAYLARSHEEATA